MKRFPAWRAGPGRIRLVAAAAAAPLLWACAESARAPLGPGDGPELQDTVPAGLVVSEPQNMPPGFAGAGSGAAGAGAEEVAVAYVSVAPGTLPGAVSVRIRNVTTGDPPTPPIPVHEGGFDPVAVPASAGDRLELAVLDAGGLITHVYASVPVRRPPAVVRTNPPRGRTDVALSVVPLVVFSEPIDAGSLEDAAVRLLHGAGEVSGAVALVADRPFMVEFTPDNPLEPATEYELVVTTAVHDLDGDALEEEYRATFRTTSSAAAGVALSIVSGDGQEASPGQELAEPFVVRVTDGYGSPVADAAVTWSVNWPSGVLAGLWDVCYWDEDVVHGVLRTTVTTDAEGFATMSFTPTSFGWALVRAELADFEGVSVTFTPLDARDPGASIEIVSGNDQEVGAGPAFEGEPLVVRVKDGDGAPVPNVTVLWSVKEGVVDGGCSGSTLSGWWDGEGEDTTFLVGSSYVRTGADGTAAIEFRPQSVGLTEVHARITGIPGSVTFNFDVASVVIALSDASPSFLDPHGASDAGVPLGGAVQFWNRRQTARIVSTSTPPGGSAFDTGTLLADERHRFVPDVAGRWEFRDEVSEATGTLTVRSPDTGHGTIQLSNVSTGGAFDLDGYRVRFKAPGHRPRELRIEPNLSYQMGGIPAGPVLVELDDLDPNCSLSGEAAQSVTVAKDAVVGVEFSVTCVPPPELASVRLVFSRTGVTGDDLWAMRADGSDLRHLTSGFRPIVSPDGSRIALTRSEPHPGWGTRRDIHLTDANAAGIRRLTDGRWSSMGTSWSPDGGSIVGTRTWGINNIIVARMDGTTSWNVAWGGSPTWSPDGSTIAFYRDGSPVGEASCDGLELWRMDPDGTNQRRLRRLQECSFDPRGRPLWSPDGRRILFSDGRMNPRLWSMSADGSDAVQVWDPWPLRVDEYWSLSADGTLLAMTVSRSGCRDHRWDMENPTGGWWGCPGERLSDVYLLDLETLGLVRVTAGIQATGVDFLR